MRCTEAESSSLSVPSPRTTVASSNDRMAVGFVFILAIASIVREEVGCVVGGCCDDSSEGGRVGEKEGGKIGEEWFDQLL